MAFIIIPAAKRDLVDKKIEQMRTDPLPMHMTREQYMQKGIGELAKELGEIKTKKDLIVGHRYGVISFSQHANAWRNRKLLKNHGEIYLSTMFYQDDGTYQVEGKFIMVDAWGAPQFCEVLDGEDYDKGLYIEM